MSDSTKPRLTLMPEVLPTPPVLPADASAGAHRSSSDARRRTLAHLQRVMATATTAAMFSAACGPSRPIDVPGSAPPDKNGETPPDTRDTDTTVPPGPGYIVVDMLPPPALCSGVAASVRAAAAWEQDADGWLIQLTLSRPEGGLLDDGRRRVTSLDGDVMEAQLTADGGLTIRWRPSDTRRGAGTLMVPAMHGDFGQSILVEISLDPPSERAAGKPAPVSLLDTCR